MRSAFDIIGPIMIGPSSSHTAGAVRLGLMARAILGEEVKIINIKLYGSFAQTYKGHGTDRALIAGIMGFKPDDERIRNSLEIAKEKNIEFNFSKVDLGYRHPLAGWRKRRTESRRRTDAGVRRAVCGADYLRRALQRTHGYLCVDCAGVCVRGADGAVLVAGDGAGDADTMEHAVHRRHFVCRGVLNHAGIVLPEYRAEACTDVSCGAADEPRIRVRGAVRRDFSGRKADHPNGTGLSGDFRGGGAERNDGIIKKNSRKMYEYALTSG